MKLTLKEDKIHAGRYSLENITKIGQLINLITSPSGMKIKLTQKV